MAADNIYLPTEWLKKDIDLSYPSIKAFSSSVNKIKPFLNLPNLIRASLYFWQKF